MNMIKQKGITLIELMIALILALLVTAAILTIFISNVKSSAENVQMMQLNQELRAAMNFMSDELKRHGYSSDSTSSAMNTLQPAPNTTSNCVRYGYTASGAVQTIRGFWLDAGSLQWCSDNNAACGGGCGAGWQPITSPETTVSTFTVERDAVPSGSVTIERLNIVLEAERQLNPGSAVREIEESIRIRNEAP